LRLRRRPPFFEREKQIASEDEETTLVESKHVRLRVGVIGLGRLWETRHKPSMARLKDRFRITAVYDQIHRRAQIEAEQLDCAACAGISALIERDDVDVVYLLTPQWFGIYPAILACEAGKAIYCGLPLASDPVELESLAKAVRVSQIQFMPELARRYYPATLRLKELIATTLGPPRLVLGHIRLFGFDRYAVPGPATQISPAPLLIDPGSYLIDWCGYLMQASPTTISGTRATVVPVPDSQGQEPDFESFSIGFSDGAAAQISLNRHDRDRWGEATRFLPPAGFQIFAERGAAWLEMPDRIQWWDSSGIHEERLPLEPTVGDVLNDQFHRLVTGRTTQAPDLHDAIKMAHLVRDLRRSQNEGVVVRCSQAD
jgi:predicted dehydrogenase